MNIDVTSMIAGFSLVSIRDFFRKLKQSKTNVSDICAYFGLNQAEGSLLLQHLIDEGFLEPEEDSYHLTPLAGQLSMASARKPFLRATATQKLQEFMDRVLTVNKHDHYPYKITFVALFGSMLSRKERVGDVDLVINLEPRAGFQPNLTQKKELIGFLKGGSPVLSLQEEDEILDQCHYLIILDENGNLAPWQSILNSYL